MTSCCVCVWVGAVGQATWRGYSSAHLEMDDVNGIRAKAGLVAILLIGGMAACGDDGDSDAGASGNGRPEADSSGSTGRDEATDSGNEPGDATALDGEASETVSADDIDPCALLEPSEVGTHFAEDATISEGEAQDLVDESGSLCDWDVTGTDSYDRLVVKVTTLSAQPYGSFDRWSDIMFTDPRELGGIGDDAVVTSDGTELWVIVGDIMVGIDGLDEGSEQGLEELALLALDRL